MGGGVLSKLYLGKMPTEHDVAQATVFFLADRAVSGETFMPSGGLSVERSTTERELFGSSQAGTARPDAGQDGVDHRRTPSPDYLAETARAFIEDCHVARVVLITPDGPRGLRGQFKAQLEGETADALTSLVKTSDIEAAMDEALIQWGQADDDTLDPFRRAAGQAVRKPTTRLLPTSSAPWWLTTLPTTSARQPPARLCTTIANWVLTSPEVCR